MPPSSNVEIHRTTDWALVKRIATHPKVWPHISDDASPAPEDWEPDPKGIYLAAMQGPEELGLSAFQPRNSVTCVAHICFLPCAWGARARTAFHLSLDWVWRNTQFLRIVGEIPIENRLAVKFAVRAGFSAYGINRASRMYHGRLSDQIALGISKYHVTR